MVERVGLSKYYMVEERDLVLCGLNVTSQDDWTRMSWTTVWTTWVALAIICVFSLTHTIVFIWRRVYTNKSIKCQEASSSIPTKTGSAASTQTVLVTEEDLEHVLAVLSQDDSGVDGQWEDVIDKQSDSVSYNAIKPANYI